MTAQPAGSFEWRWVDIGGQQHRVRFDELAQALGRSRLPPHTLVWRAGWLEWVPAANVPELNHALGIGHSGPPFVVRSDPEALAPPPPPLGHYAMTVPRGTLTLERAVDSSLPPPRGQNRGRSAIPVPSEPPPVVGPPIPVRNVMPTLSEDGLPSRSATLRPMGALPPPPRGVPAPKRPPFSSIPPVVPRTPGPALAQPPRTPAPPAATAKPPHVATAPGGAGAVPRVPSTPPPRGGPTVPQVPSLHIPNAAPPPRGPFRDRPAPSNVPSLNIPAGATLPKGVGDIFATRGTSSAPPPPSSRRKAGAPAAPSDATAIPRAAESSPTASAPPPRAIEKPHLPSVIVTPHPPPPDAATPAVDVAFPRRTPEPVATPATDVARSKTKAEAPFAKAEHAARAAAAATAKAGPAPGKPEGSGKRGQHGAGGLSRRTVTTLTSAGVLIPGIVLLTAALMRPSHKAHEAALPYSAPSAVVPPPPPPKPVGCTVGKPAERLAAQAYLAVPTLVAAAPGGPLAAVGLAATKEHALGLTVDLGSLAVNTVFEQTVTGSTTLSVVPLVRSGVLEYNVDRADAKLPAARTVDAATRFTIAAGADSISRVVGSATDVIWTRSAQGNAITTPRVASVAGTGHAVVLRDGGQEGAILAGWLKEDGTKLTELSPVKANAALVGTPTVSASAHGVLIAFAAKTATTDAWHVELATARTPELPSASRAFSLPAAGPGGEAISPAVEALGDGRFLLQWTEGSAGNRAVRAQLISADLDAVGDPVTLSASDQNAGQGALWVEGNQVLALFLVQKEASHELWGASLRCP